MQSALKCKAAYVWVSLLHMQLPFFCPSTARPWLPGNGSQGDGSRLSVRWETAFAKKRMKMRSTLFIFVALSYLVWSFFRLKRIVKQLGKQVEIDIYTVE